MVLGAFRAFKRAREHSQRDIAIIQDIAYSDEQYRNILLTGATRGSSILPVCELL